MKLVRKIVLGMIIVLISIIFFAGIYLTNGLEAGEKLGIYPISISEQPDGIYEGSYSGGRWSNRVVVTIEAGKITDINILESVLIEKPEITSKLIAKVLAKQDLTIDAVSGATVTSKAYLKAIEQALKK
ncbi:MAG: FMN-binding protein [Clostridia bacterium]